MLAFAWFSLVYFLKISFFLGNVAGDMAQWCAFSNRLSFRRGAWKELSWEDKHNEGVF
jgi:hypothetical protein